jgi:hypothetical protein
MQEKCETAKRVELFAHARKMVYGILHTFFVAYSSETMLLQLAEASSNVVHVRTLSTETEGLRKLVEDRLILRRTPSNIDQKPFTYRALAPSILVPVAWRERMHLMMGDKIVISRDAREYALPPPTVK